MTCPKCGSNNTIKWGKNRHGKPRRKCKECNYQFVNNDRSKIPPKSSDVIGGQSQKANDRLNKSLDGVFSRLEKICERLESLFDAWQEVIFDYGKSSLLHPNSSPPVSEEKPGLLPNSNSPVREQALKLHPNSSPTVNEQPSLIPKHIEKIKVHLKNRGYNPEEIFTNSLSNAKESFNEGLGWIEDKLIKGNLYSYYRCRVPDKKSPLSIYLGKA